MTRTNIAATMTRFLPSTSAIAPVNGAVIATASVLTVMMLETCAALALNSVERSGRIACGEYRLMKAPKPATATATCAKVCFLASDRDGAGVIVGRASGAGSSYARVWRCEPVAAAHGRFRSEWNPAA